MTTDRRGKPKTLNGKKVKIRILNRVDVPEGSKVLMDRTVDTDKGRRIGRIVLTQDVTGSYLILGEGKTFMDRTKLHNLGIQFMRELEVKIAATKGN